MAKVFVCYAQEDLSLVKLLVQVLEEQENIPVWFANRDIQYSDNIDEQVQSAIRSSIIFLYCASKTTADRARNTFLAKEQQIALARVKSDPSFRVLSVKMDSVKVENLPQYFGSHIIANFSRSIDWSREMSKLANTIRFELANNMHKED